MPPESPTGLYWSLRGAVLCAEHAAQVDTPTWLAERWEPLPETSQGLHGARYQCQRCSPTGTAVARLSDRPPYVRSPNSPVA
jgi:hypothetical protein